MDTIGSSVIGAAILGAALWPFAHPAIGAFLGACCGLAVSFKVVAHRKEPLERDTSSNQNEISDIERQNL
jgi:hypothetical protein